MNAIARVKFYLIACILAAVAFSAAVALAGCAEQEKKLGLTILNALEEAKRTAVQTVKAVDIKKQTEFAKRLDAVQESPSATPDEEALKVKTIEVELVEHGKQVNAAYNFLAAIENSLVVAKVALMSGAKLPLILAPVLAVAMDLEAALKVLGVNTSFVTLITGSK